MIILLKNKQSLQVDEFKFKCSIGKNGSTSKKLEGDGKTPKGVYSIDNLYYRADRLIKPFTRLKTIKIKKFHGWCDDLKSKTIIRLTSDCPFIDPSEIKRVLEIHDKNNNDYTTNTFEGSTIVDGFDVEVFSYEALKRAAKEAFLPSHREHVTFYFKKENW